MRISEGQIRGVNVGDSQQSVVHRLGQPISLVAQPSGISILQYGSTAPSMAQYVYVSGGVVVQRSISYFGLTRELQEYIQNFGVPNRSLYVSDTPLRDSFRLVINIWPDKGLAVTSEGSSATSIVMREDTFRPMTLSAYLSSWGSSLAGHEMSTVSAVVVAKPQTASTLAANNRASMETGIGVVGLVFVIVLMVFVIRRRSISSSAEKR